MFIDEDMYDLGASLDSAEAVLIADNHTFERVENEIHFSASTPYTDLHGHIHLREDRSSLGIAYIFEQKVPVKKFSDVASLACIMNEALILGHFEVSSLDRNIIWRHSVSLIGRNDPEPQEIAAIVSSGLEACEKFYPAFNFLLWAGKSPQQAAKAALFDTAGEA